MQQQKRQQRSRRALATVALAAMGVYGACNTAVHAADRSWNNPAGGNFATTTNWTAAFPTASDNAVFNINGGVYTVSFTAPAQTAQTRVQRDNVTFALGGFTYNVTSPLVGIAAADSARLTLNNGSI